MATATPILSAYLQQQKTRFLQEKGVGWTVVTGNEAGDLDTLASSIGFAWLLPHISATDTKAIALIPTPRKDFVLRAENLYAMELVGIREDFQELLCSEDMPQSIVCTSFALVDHNSLHPTNAHPNARVTAIIDHHEDEGKYADTASPRIIEPAGSCSSLVTRVIMSYPTLQIPPDLAVLLLSAIIIDTDGLRKNGKAINVDYEASAWMLPRGNVSSLENVSHQTVDSEGPKQVRDSPWIQSLSETLRAKKFALSHLTTRDLLRRDYKEYDLALSPSICGNSSRSIKAGLATVPMPLSSFFSSSLHYTVGATEEWIKERRLSVLGVLTSYKSKRGKSRREAMWVVDENVCGPKLPQALFNGLEGIEVLRAKRVSFQHFGQVEKDEGKEDEAEQESVDGEESAEAAESSPFGVGLVARVYLQKNSALTRKQVAPILKQVLLK